ncbi:MAG: hypothetical protein LH649_16595 [Pseudanabaena sp. CAN_BIN31]|nr:hypothetical protein [Pseudanabaena sp. CAN_BIN31]
MIVILYFLTKPKPQTKTPTIEDIRRKYPKRKSQAEALHSRQEEYPKRKSQEQLRAEALRSRQEDYDRKLAEKRRLHEIAKANKVNSPSNREVSINSFKTLIKMVNGDEALARRLIEGNIKNYPEKSPTWACDKAISDLERDRRT